MRKKWPKDAKVTLKVRFDCASWEIPHPTQIPIAINGETVKRAPECKYLGTIIDSKLQRKWLVALLSELAVNSAESHSDRDIWEPATFEFGIVIPGE